MPEGLQVRAPRRGASGLRFAFFSRGFPTAEDPIPRSIVDAGDGTVWRPGAGTRRRSPEASGKGEPDADRRLRDLEAKVERILEALGLREEPVPSAKPKGAGRPSPEKRERIEALNRQLEERIEALRKEHLEAIRKVLEEPSGDRDCR